MRFVSLMYCNARVDIMYTPLYRYVLVLTMFYIRIEVHINIYCCIIVASLTDNEIKSKDSSLTEG